MSPETLRSFLGWCAILNLAFVTIWFLFFFYAHDWMYRLHRCWFDLTPQTFDAIHYTGMAGYKIATWLFCIIPYLVLCFLG